MPSETSAAVTSRATNPLEPSADELRAVLAAITDRVVAHIESLPDQPASYRGDSRAAVRALRESLPEAGAPLDELLDIVFDRAAPVSFNAAGPGYLAYIPGGGIVASAAADLIADVLNRYTAVWAAAPGLVQLEVNVLRWFCEMVGYPTSAGGLLTTGGSLATFTAIVTARRERLGDAFLDGIVYTSDQTHHSTAKAAVQAGFPERNIRVLPVDDRFRLRLDALADAIATDRAAGQRPFFVAGSAGTTNTGAVDDLDALADLAERERVWLHVDAAYGGFFMLTERGRAVMRGLARADSMVLDPHKGLFLPFGTGCLLVRDDETLRRAHTTGADYMPAMQDDRDLVDFCERSPELTRDNRGLRVWLPLRLYGVAPFRANLDEKLDLAEWATEEIAAMPSVEVLAAPQLTVSAFRLAPPGRATEALNDLNRRWMERVNDRGRVFLTGTMLGDRFALRLAVLSFRTHRDRVAAGLDDLRATLAEVLSP